MIIRNDMESAAAKQLSADYCCSADDFFRYENTVTMSELKEGRRQLSEDSLFFRTATMGMGAVISCNEKMKPLADMLAARFRGTEICSARIIAVLNRELFTHGYCIGTLKHHYLPAAPYYPAVRTEGYSLELYEGEDIEKLYGLKGFDNALLYDISSPRRDILAMCAVNGRRIMGIAGASCDSPSMAQIGIDVLPEFRGMGVASALVSSCASEIFRRGLIPYYGTWSGNIVSQRLAAKCGFYPAWCEMYAERIDDRSRK